MSKQLKTVPKFANESEEQAFWEKHDSTDYLDWTKAQRVVLPNLSPVGCAEARSASFAIDAVRKLTTSYGA